MNKKSKLIMAVLGCLVLGAIGLLFYQKNARTKELEEKSDYKTITVNVIHGDKSEETFTYKTEAENLGEVLYENKLIDGQEGEYGIYITEVDAELADEGKQQWWCITKSGAQVNTSADLTPIKEGDVFELTLEEGYE